MPAPYRSLPTFGGGAAPTFGGGAASPPPRPPGTPERQIPRPLATFLPACRGMTLSAAQAAAGAGLRHYLIETLLGTFSSDPHVL